jgi:predicted AAA+ superfamily ATPase
MKELKVKEAIIITDSMEGEEDIGGDVVKVVPLWKWLLAVSQESK